MLYVGNNMVTKRPPITSESAALSGLMANGCCYHHAAYMAGQTTKESMQRSK